MSVNATKTYNAYSNNGTKIPVSEVKTTSASLILLIVFLTRAADIGAGQTRAVEDVVVLLPVVFGLCLWAAVSVFRCLIVVGGPVAEECGFAERLPCLLLIGFGKVQYNEVWCDKARNGRVR